MLWGRSFRLQARAECGSLSICRLQAYAVPLWSRITEKLCIPNRRWGQIQPGLTYGHLCGSVKMRAFRDTGRQLEVLEVGLATRISVGFQSILEL